MSADILDPYFAYVDEHSELYVERLAEAIAIPSVSGEAERRGEVVRMCEWAAEWARKLGGSVEVRDIGSQVLDGVSVPLPPVILASIPAVADPTKKTVCVYGHLDVQPARKEDGWRTEPFVLTEVDGKLYGRGTTDDKGPVLSWFWAIEAHQALGIPLPVNVKMCLEGMEESGSVGLEELVYELAKPGGFLADIDYMCISDNYWLGTKKPCITYGLRGICYFFLEIESAGRDLHSGVFGGAVHESMIDLVKVLGSLVDVSGKILVPGIYDEVAPMGPDEEASYSKVDFDLDEFRASVGVPGKLLHASKEGILQHRWRIPTLSIHGVEGAFSGSGEKTVLPGKVIGKFSLRLVPDMDPARVETLVKAYVEAVFSTLGSPSKMNISMSHGAKAWVADFNHPNYVAGRRAVQRVYGEEPDLTREGGSIPITLTFEQATGKNVLMLPVGQGDDGAHSQNEKFGRLNYINAIKLLGVYFHELAGLSAGDKGDEAAPATGAE